MHKSSSHHNILTHPFLLLALTTLFWAGNAVIARGMRLELPPFQLAFWRWFFAALLVLIILRPPLKADWVKIKAGWKPILLLGTLGVGMFNTFQYLAVQTATAINVGIISATMPIFIVVMSFLIFWERILLRQALGIVLSFVGVAIVVSRGDASVLRDLQFAPGDLWMITGIVIYGAYTALLRLRPEIHAHSFLAVTIILGAAELIPFMAWEVVTGQGVTLNIPVALTIGYTAIFPAFLAHLFFNRAVAEIGANRASAFFNLIPVYVTVLATVFLGESLSRVHVLGMGLILCGIILTTRTDRSPRVLNRT